MYLLAIILCIILRYIAHDMATMFQIAIAPAIVGSHKENVIAQRKGRFNTAVDHLHNVALAAPIGILGKVAWAIRFTHPTENSSHRPMPFGP